MQQVIDMTEREPTLLRRLLDRLLSTRARRDREVRYSDAWQTADTELREIEREIFRAPPSGDGGRPDALPRSAAIRWGSAGRGAPQAD